MEMDHLLTHSGLHLEVSSMASPGVFCLLVCSLFMGTYNGALLYVANNFCCIPV